VLETLKKDCTGEELGRSDGNPDEAVSADELYSELENSNVEVLEDSGDAEADTSVEFMLKVIELDQTEVGNSERERTGLDSDIAELDSDVAELDSDVAELDSNAAELDSEAGDPEESTESERDQEFKVERDVVSDDDGGITEREDIVEPRSGKSRTCGSGAVVIRGRASTSAKF
jgi:septal ring factor EnvC (AmiA/AmiB activator)